MRGRPTAARRASAALFLFTLLAWASPSYALDNVTISTFQGSFVALPLYVAKAYKLFEKNGLDAQLLYGTGIQPTNILVGGSANFGDFAIEHGVNLIGKNQDLKLLVVCQGATPYGLIVRNDVPTPNLHKPYPQMLKDLKGLKLGVVAQPLRAALTGSLASPGLFEVMEVLGREETLGRIEDAASGAPG